MQLARQDGINGNQVFKVLLVWVRRYGSVVQESLPLDVHSHYECPLGNTLIEVYSSHKVGVSVNSDTAKSEKLGSSGVRDAPMIESRRD